jgi:hypothetical protein
VSQQLNGSYVCDRCGTDVGNGGIYSAAMVADLHPDDPTEIRRLHLCRAARTGAPRGCVGYVLGDGTLAAWAEAQEA